MLLAHLQDPATPKKVAYTTQNELNEFTLQVRINK